VCAILSRIPEALSEDVMRASYLDRESFLREARALVRWSEQLERESFTPGATALLVIDMQGWFLDKESHAFLPDGVMIIPRVRALAQAFTAAGLPLIFTRHINTKENAGSMATWWSDLIRPDDPHSAITRKLDTEGGVVLVKSQYDAFHGTRLETMLREKGIERVVITGVATHLCCETTARSAFVKGFRVTVPYDATATYDESHHLAALLNLSHGFATITSTDALKRAVHSWKKAP
jgi:nicotinamidase-related amidase